MFAVAVMAKSNRLPKCGKTYRIVPVVHGAVKLMRHSVSGDTDCDGC